MATDIKVEDKSMNVQKKKTKKTFLVPEDRLHEILSYKVRTVPPWLAERDPSRAATIEKYNKIILAKQDRMRREYEAQGYATFEAEVTDDEEDEDAELPVIDTQGEEKKQRAEDQVDTQGEEKKQRAEDQDEGVAAGIWILPRGRGRRRFRPGVMKHASGIKKLL